MLNIWLFSLGSALVVSLVSFIGVASLSLNQERFKRSLIFLVSFSAGALIGGAFLHLLPEAVEKIGYSQLLAFGLIGGIFIFFILEKYIHWQHCHIEEHEHRLGKMNLIGEGLHNFIDGLIIATSFLVSVPLGVAATFAIILHEIPQEIGDFGVLLHSGYTRKQALYYNFLSALFAVLGVVIALILGDLAENLSLVVLPVAAAGFIYIACADLIPEVHKTTKVSRSFWQVISFIAGVVIMYFLTYLE